MPNTESNLPTLIASSALVDRRDAPERLLEEQARQLAGALEAGHELHAREHHHRQLGRRVAEVGVRGVDEERRRAADAGGARQEAVDEARIAAGVDARIGGRGLAARVDRRRERVDAVVQRGAGVGRVEAGPVALRLGEADVDVAGDDQRRDLGGRPGRRLLDRLCLSPALGRAARPRRPPRRSARARGGGASAAAARRAPTAVTHAAPTAAIATAPRITDSPGRVACRKGRSGRSA